MQRFLIKYLSFLLALSFSISCQPEEEAASVESGIGLLSVLSVNPKEAEARIELSDTRTNTAKEYGVVWATNPAPTIADNKRAAATNPSGGLFTLSFSDLQIGETYYVRAYLRISDTYLYSSEIVLYHNGPFIWRSLTGVNWSDQASSVSSVALGSGVIVVRPADALNTEAWYYSIPNDTWIQQKNLVFPDARFDPLIFKLNKFGEEAAFFGGGYQVNENVAGKYIYLKDFWQYSFFGGGIEEEYPDFPFGYSPLSHFTIDHRTYVLENRADRNIWMLLNGMSWHKKNNFPGSFLGRYVGFSIGQKGYILVESKTINQRSGTLYEYDPDVDSWTLQAQFPGEDRIDGVAFSLKGKGYYGLGQAKDTPGGFRDIWQYDPVTDSWEKLVDYPGIGNVQVTANTVGNKAYLGLGYRVKTGSNGVAAYLPASDFWELVP